MSFHSEFLFFDEVRNAVVRAGFLAAEDDEAMQVFSSLVGFGVDNHDFPARAASERSIVIDEMVKVFAHRHPTPVRAIELVQAAPAVNS